MANQPVPIDQLVNPDKYVLVTLKLVHDTLIVSHPGRDKAVFHQTEILLAHITG